MSIETISLWIMAILYLLAGINHFVMPRFYESIIPPIFGNKKLINWVSGAAEIVLSILLVVPSFTSVAAWGIITLLVAVFPANIYHFLKGWRKKQKILILAVRLPLQFLLIWWAYSFT